MKLRNLVDTFLVIITVLFVWSMFSSRKKVLKKLTISLHDLYDYKYGFSLPIRDTLYQILNFFELKMN